MSSGIKDLPPIAESLVFADGGRVQVGRDSGDVVRRTTRCACVDGLFSSFELETLHVLYVMWLKDVRTLNTNCTLKNYGLGEEVSTKTRELALDLRSTPKKIQ